VAVPVSIRTAESALAVTDKSVNGLFRLAQFRFGPISLVWWTELRGILNAEKNYKFSNLLKGANKTV
jgi:hypothetical protein